VNSTLLHTVATLDLALLGTSLAAFLLFLWVTFRVIKAAVRDGIRDAMPRRAQPDWAPTERQTL